MDRGYLGTSFFFFSLSSFLLSFFFLFPPLFTHSSSFSLIPSFSCPRAASFLPSFPFLPLIEFYSNCCSQNQNFTCSALTVLSSSCHSISFKFLPVFHSFYFSLTHSLNRLTSTISEERERENRNREE